MSTLFKKLPAEKRKSFRQEIRLSQKEFEEIKFNASIRNLAVSEFIRRAALGRRADVKIETHIVLQLSLVVQEIRALRKTMVELGLNPPDEKLLELIEQACSAILQVAN